LVKLVANLQNGLAPVIFSTTIIISPESKLSGVNALKGSGMLGRNGKLGGLDFDVRSPARFIFWWFDYPQALPSGKEPTLWDAETGYSSETTLSPARAIQYDLRSIQEGLSKMATGRGTGDIRGFLSTMAPALSQCNLDDKAIWLRSSDDAACLSITLFGSVSV
jgi:hypothetical protein